MVQKQFTVIETVVSVSLNDGDN